MAKTSTYLPQKEDLAEAPQVGELLKNLEFHRAIQNITRRISSAMTAQEILVDIKEDIRKLFNFHILTIYLVDKFKNEIYTIKNDASEVRFPVDYSTFAGWVVLKKKTLHIADAYNNRELRNIHDTLSFDSTLDRRTGVLTGQIVATPILRDGLILGVMEIMNKKDGNKIDEYNQIFLDEITGFLANAFFVHLNFSEIRELYRAKFNALIQKGAITSGQLDQAIMKSNISRKDITAILMERYQIPKSDIAQALTDFHACPFTGYNDHLPAPVDILLGIEKAVLINMLWVPLKVVKGRIHVLLNDPSDTQKRKKIEQILESQDIQYELSLADDILRFIERFYQQKEKSATKARQTGNSPLVETGTASDVKPVNQIAKDHLKQEVSSFARRRTITLEPAEEFSDDTQGFMEMKNQFDAMTPFSETASLNQTDSMPESFFQKEETHTRKIARNNGLSRAPEAKFPDIEDLTEIRSSRIPVSSSAPRVANDQNYQLLTSIVYEAASRQASDIHFEPDISSGLVNVRMRVSGDFFIHQALGYQDYKALIKQIKTLSRLEIENSKTIQEGKFFLSRTSGNDISMSVTFIPTSTGMEDTVIHMAAKLKKIPLELLGLSESHYATLVNILQQPRGLVFFVGQPHSGITTTLHACLDNINSQDLKIWTAEEPIEIVQNGLRQVRIDPHQGLSMPKVLRSFLKADPDVIMASQITDTETAAICMQAAINGRLVLTSLWSENIPDTLERCSLMDINHLVFADAMLAIVEQRLIHVLCPKCKEKYHPGREEYEELVEIYGKASFEKHHIPFINSFMLFRPKGCPSCGQTGYSGRMCVSEILIFTPQIKRMIRRKESPQSIYQAAIESGMTTLMQDGLLKVLSGFSDARHVRLVCLK